MARNAEDTQTLSESAKLAIELKARIKKRFGAVKWMCASTTGTPLQIEYSMLDSGLRRDIRRVSYVYGIRLCILLDLDPVELYLGHLVDHDYAQLRANLVAPQPTLPAAPGRDIAVYTYSAPTSELVRQDDCDAAAAVLDAIQGRPENRTPSPSRDDAIAQAADLLRAAADLLAGKREVKEERKEERKVKEKEAIKEA